MSPAMVAPMNSRSTLELMLELIQKRDGCPKGIPPALPMRPMSKGRLPSSRVSFPPFINDCNVIKVPLVKDSEIRVLSKENDTEEHGEFAGLPSLESYEDNCSFKVGSGGGIDFAMVSLNKTFISEYIVEDVLNKMIVGAKESFDDIQNAAILIQSLIHGERSRHRFQILRKRWVSAVFVQSVLRGWLARRRLMILKNNELLKLEHVANLKIHKIMKVSRELPWVHLSVVKELHTRILDAEARLTQKQQENDILQEQLQNHLIKNMMNMEIEGGETNALLGSIASNLGATATLCEMENENAVLKQQLQQQEKRLLDYDAKMKIAEEMWQKKIASLQISLDVAMKNIAYGLHENKKSCKTLMEEFQQSKQIFEEDLNPLPSYVRPCRHGTSPYEELQKLESRPGPWKSQPWEKNSNVRGSGTGKSRPWEKNSNVRGSGTWKSRWRWGCCASGKRKI